MYLQCRIPSLHTPDVHLSSCGEEVCIPAKTVNAGISAALQFHWVVSGSGTFCCDDQVFSIRSGQVFITRPGARVTYTPDRVTPWHYFWMQFSGSEMTELLTSLGIPDQLYVLDAGHPPGLHEAFTRLLQWASVPGNRLLRLFGQALLILDMLTEKYCEARRIGKIVRSKDQLLESALATIQGNLHHTLRIGDIASQLHIDRSTLHQLFSDALGQSPQQYLIRQRMERAVLLLESTAFPVGDVARSVGYSDVFLFSRTFRKTFGCPPSQWRKKLNEF